MNTINKVIGMGLVLSGAASMGLSAQTVTEPQTGNIVFWGPGGSSAYGQTISMPTTTQLDSFTFTAATSTNSNSFNFNTFIYAFNPTTSTQVGSVLYESPVQNLPSSGTISITITPNLVLTGGTTYIVLITSTSQVQTPPNSSGADANLGTSTVTYANGYFYYNNGTFLNGNAVSTPMWSQNGSLETAFTAIFGPVMVFTQASSPIFFSTAGLTGNEQAVVARINAGIAQSNSTANFTALVNALLPLSNNPASLASALDQLSPQAFGRFASSTAFNNASFDTEAMDSYLATRRDAGGDFLGGNGIIDASGLTVNDPSYDPGLAMIHSRMLAWNPPTSTGVISDEARPLLGGIEMRDSKDMKATNRATTSSDPWNFFVRGNVVLAQGASQPGISHFDDTTESVVLGADYRITPHVLVGLTAGYGHTDANLDENGSSATVDSYSPGLYASYADQGWYVDATGNYVRNNYTQARNISFLGQTANSATEGNEGVVNLDGGYEFHEGVLTVGPLVGVQYTHLTVDSYGETGSIADLAVNRQDSDSLRSRLGGRVSYAFSGGGVTFNPHFDASWEHEFMDQSRALTSQFDGQGLGSFNVTASSPQRDFALLDAGLEAKFNDTFTLFADYLVQAGQSNYFGQSVQAGLRIAF